MKGLERLSIPVEASVRDAMRAIEGGGVEICLVMAGDRLHGVVTDGDVRRALLDGATLDASVARCTNTEYVAVSAEVGRAEALDLMLARGITQLPIVDGERRLLGLHLLRELLGNQERPNWAVVMAGGQGTRLRPLTERVPKPMIRVAGRPILERLVLHLVGYGIRRVFIAINYLGDVIERHFGDGSGFGCRIEYLREPEPLDSGGAVALLPEPPASPLLVLNGDLITQVNVDRLLRHHEEGGFPATVGVLEYHVPVPFGVIDPDPAGRVAGLREKPSEVYLVNAGIYVLSPAWWVRLPRGERFTMPEVLGRCLAAGEPPGMFLIEDDWVDVGRHEELRRARGEVADG